ncbi:MAG TPA: hypothetical protein P5267_03825, partial [Patescibacteria group bacterium]|nr:hypothetical protein [Patescibacteria group bacterium]
AGLIDALGVAIYVVIVALIMQNGEKIFGKMSTIIGPVAFLLLFVVSAAITGALTLGRPVMLYLDNKKAEAVKLFIGTIGWLLLLMVMILASQILK